MVPASQLVKDSYAYEAQRVAQIVAEQSDDNFFTVILCTMPWRRWFFKRLVVSGIQRLLLVGYED